MRLPTLQEINRYDSLDEREAAKHFLGKSLEQAQALFEDSSSVHQEDLMWMGPRAFRFYVPAAVAYLRSDQGRIDCDMLSSFAGVLEFWMENDSEELRPIAAFLADACAEIVRKVSWVDFDGAIHGDLMCRYEACARALSRIR